ncbi:aldolase [Candidatus Wirthbacteria bacterium CG2_30_54_11]|uniref:fructose-bisphosphate aldolase n=1 Tax=Candidatus Wirthbacteria bacterium CG2_30_54_11 TaxID=1817892 RepID=A0A1J5J035_9BACT|nr:MAG: aldolase [Candidatus Wirthbacteria bacterium CG2_30_54_11]
MTEKQIVHIPMDVPRDMRGEYEKNYLMLTHESGNLMLFAGDQKVEHLNDDFFGKDIAAEDADPEHLFRIASKAKIGVFAAQLGLIARYGESYPEVPYLVKVNSKSPIVPTEQEDPFSNQWYDIQQVVEFKENSGLNILGVGYTVYLGSEYENQQLQQAAQVIYEAHQNGLISVLWMYPRGKAVKDERDPHLVAGATGTAACLGTDFVKVNFPKKAGVDIYAAFQEAVKSAGRTKVVCAGGGSQDAKSFLQSLHDQIHVSGASGNATGRNIHQRPLDEAVRLTNAIYAITVEGATVEQALNVYKGQK